MELKDILLNLAEQNSQRSIEIGAFAFATLVLFVFTGFCFYKQTERLNEHKKVIELMNEANKSQQKSINLLMKNQILLNNKLKRYEQIKNR